MNIFHKYAKKWGKWYSRQGYKFINLEAISIIFLIIIFIWFLRNQPTGFYRYQGISGGKFVLDKQKKKGPSPHSKKENKCRHILERIYCKPFPSVRPSFLKNPATGKNLEIDCFNEDLKLGLEYDGAQHSKYNPFFHRRGPKEFLYQTKKDDYKDRMCEVNDITLIRIPHWVLEADLENYIRNKLRSKGKL